jgi:hypothetical protein
VVLFSVLVASALGSYYSKKLSAAPTQILLLITPVLLLAYTFMLDRVLTLAIAWPLWIRHGIAFFVILPLGFMMGMFFPKGVRTLSLSLESAIPWAWAVNASASVVGSVLAVLIALSYGFTMVLNLAALAYSLALVVLFVQNRNILALSGKKYR